MNHECVIQPAAKEQAEGIGFVIRDAIERVNANDYPPEEIDRLLRNFSSETVLKLLEQRQTLVALVGDNVVATGAIQGSEVKSVFVSPEWHRKGIGSSVMREIERLAASQGKETLVVSSSLSAKHFYTALGFIEKSRNFFGNEETILMTKALNQTPSG